MCRKNGLVGGMASWRLGNMIARKVPKEAQKNFDNLSGETARNAKI